MATPSTSLPTRRRFDASASLVLIGIPGVGKRSLGFIAASHLKRRFCTENQFFEACTGLTKAAFLGRYGREALLSKSLVVLEQLLQDNATDCVIECGANSLAPSARQLLAGYALTHPVIHVTRDLFEVHSPSRLPPLDASRLRHVDAGHRLCSNFEFFNVFDNTNVFGDSESGGSQESATVSSPVVLRQAKRSFCSFVDAILRRRSPSLGQPFNNPPLFTSSKQRSFTTVWRLSRLVNGSLSLLHDVSGVHAIELCVDMWGCHVLDHISKFVAGIRHHLCLPVIYFVDPCASGMTKTNYWQAISHGLRLGVDGMVIDGSAPDDMHRWFLASQAHMTSICQYEIGGTNQSHAWRHPDRQKECIEARDRGYDVIRLVQGTPERSDNDDLQYFRQQLHTAEEGSIPLVAYNAGELGRPSKLHNIMLTPVRSASPRPLEADCADRTGDVTIQEITRALFASWEYDRLHYHVYGTAERAFSRSPAMYKAAFDVYGLSHIMYYRSAATVQEILDCTRAEDFGGGAVSFPFKEALFEACVLRSKHAIAIGSVNSVMPLRTLAGHDTHDLDAQAAHRNKQGSSDGLYGDNSDWLGFFNAIRNHQSPRNAVLGPLDTALILGAGGSARSAIYALISLGYQKIYIRNRTAEKAEKVATHFNQWCLHSGYEACKIMVLDAADSQWPAETRLPTVIIACVPTETDFHFPDSWLGSSTGGIAAEVSRAQRAFFTARNTDMGKQISYKQSNSLFLEQVSNKSSSSGRFWSIVDGYEILMETAVVQFEFLTGYRAPRTVMARHLRVTHSQG